MDRTADTREILQKVELGMETRTFESEYIDSLTTHV